MIELAGFSVHDIGIDSKPEEFIEAALDHNAQIVGMLALLATTMKMKNPGFGLSKLNQPHVRAAVPLWC